MIVDLIKMLNFASYVKERIETRYFKNLLVHLLRLRQRNHHFQYNSETKQSVHAYMSMGCCFVLSCRRVVAPVV